MNNCYNYESRWKDNRRVKNQNICRLTRCRVYTVIESDSIRQQLQWFHTK